MLDFTCVTVGRPSLLLLEIGEVAIRIFLKSSQHIGNSDVTVRLIPHLQVRSFRRRSKVVLQAVPGRPMPGISVQVFEVPHAEDAGHHSPPLLEFGEVSVGTSRVPKLETTIYDAPPNACLTHTSSYGHGRNSRDICHTCRLPLPLA